MSDLRPALTAAQHYRAAAQAITPGPVEVCN